jgi:hypothetical protein
MIRRSISCMLAGFWPSSRRCSSWAPWLATIRMAGGRFPIRYCCSAPSWAGCGSARRSRRFCGRTPRAALRPPKVPFNREWDSDFGSRKSPARRVGGASRLDYASLCSSVGKQFGARGLSSRPPVGLAQNPLRHDQQQPRSMTCRSRPHRQQTPRLPRSKTSRSENASKSRLGARTGKRGNRRVVGEAPPHFILSQQRDAEIAAELLPNFGDGRDQAAAV